MSWTGAQWEAFAAVLQHGFAAREPFTDADAGVYRLLLDDVPPDRAMVALRSMVAKGKTYRPKPGEIVGELRADPGVPTFAEVYQLIFGARGVLAAQPPVGPCSERERQAAQLEAAAARAAPMHPLIGGFVRAQGLERLRRLGLDEDTYGALRRADLERAWGEFVEAGETREVAALVAGEGEAGLRRLDPLGALGVPAPAQLAPGDGA